MSAAIRRHLLGAFALPILLLACGDDRAPADAAWSGVLFEDGSLNEALIGTWRAPGRGYLLDITATGYHVYVEAGALCYADPRPNILEDNLPAASLVHGTVTDGEETVQVVLLDELPARFTLQRISRIPAACRQPPATDPAAVFEAFGTIFDLDYAFFSERHVDWQARLTELTPRAAAAHSDTALFAVMTDALQGLDDAHTNLFALTGTPLEFNAAGDFPTKLVLEAAFAAQTAVPDFRTFVESWQQGVTDQISAKLTGGSGPRLGGLVMWGRLPGNVGYLRITAMDGFVTDAGPGNPTLANMAAIGAEVDRAIAQLADTRAMIVDVAHNGGGEDAVSWEIAGRFAAAPHPAFTARFHRPQGMEDDAWSVEPRGPAPYGKPVYVLTSDLTASAAESFALMMKALPNVTLAGQPTNGVFSEIPPKVLPGGHFAVTLSTQRVVDPSGRSFEVTGIPPALVIPLFDLAHPETVLTGHAAAIDQLLATITR